jgi:hypothetical protein
MEKAMKDKSGGVHLTMKGRLQSTGQEVVAVAYKYSKKKKVQMFVMHPEFGSTTNGVPYEMKYVNPNGSLIVRPIDRPQCVGEYYSYANIIDTHNHLRQSELGLEESCQTQDCYVRLATSLIGFNVIDSLLMAKKYKLVSEGITTMQYVSILSKQLLDLSMEKRELDLMRRLQHDDFPHLPERLGELVDHHGKWLPKKDTGNSDGDTVKSTGSSLSDSSSQSSNAKLSHTNFLPGEIRRDKNDCLHELMITDKQETVDCHGKKKVYRMMRKCDRKDCGNLTRFYCKECPANGGKNMFFCAPYDRVTRECFYWHVESVPELGTGKRLRSSV